MPQGPKLSSPKGRISLVKRPGVAAAIAKWGVHVQQLVRGPESELKRAALFSRPVRSEPKA
jgi:hypothetical protein